MKTPKTKPTSLGLQALVFFGCVMLAAWGVMFVYRAFFGGQP